MFLPPFAPVTERGAERVVWRAFVFPPLGAIREPHRMVSADGEFAKTFDLISESFRCAPIVIIPVANYFAESLTASKVALLSDVALLGQVNEVDPVIFGNEVSNVLPVREDQKLQPRIRLLLETLDCLREPRSPVPREAKARHETVAAGPPRELPGR
jgi:hypothetical protein